MEENAKKQPGPSTTLNKEESNGKKNHDATGSEMYHNLYVSYDILYMCTHTHTNTRAQY